MRFGTATEAIENLPRLASRGGLRRKINICTQSTAEAELASAQKLNARFIAFGEAQYSPALAAIDHAPPLLCVRGHANLMVKPAVAIVGARNASAAGNKLARVLADSLSQAGYVIVSGMARGIDTSAHHGSLSAGTVAVLAGGIDHIYPKENEDLYHKIADQGALVSEQPIGIAPQARDFPRRNRIISGLARGVVVIEASERSGSLITAQFALEQGREVFAVPGSPLDPRSRGANRLIRDGAALIESADHILEVLEMLDSKKIKEDDLSHPNLEEAQSRKVDDEAIDRAHSILEDLLSPTPIFVDELIRQSGEPTAAILAAILELELAGKIERHAGGQVSRPD